MRIEIVSFDPAHLPAVAEFCERTWDRPSHEEFYRWRYLECPNQRLLLALQGSRCVAMVGAFRREYLMNGRRRACLETFDWFCLPELRGSGLGIRVMRAMMVEGEPIVAVGGTEDTRSLLPRLGWRAIGSGTRHLLPLEGMGVADALRRRIGIPQSLGRTVFALAASRWYRPRRQRRPSEGRVEPMVRMGPELDRLYAEPTGYALLPLPHAAQLGWLTRPFAGAGHFVPLLFREGAQARGWVLARIGLVAGHCEAVLVDLYAPRPTEALYAWMVSEALAILRPYRPEWVAAQATCPLFRTALKRNRFLEVDSFPVCVWSREPWIPAGPLHVVCNTSDSPLLPYPTRRDQAEAPDPLREGPS